MTEQQTRPAPVPCVKCGATDHWTRWLARELPGYGFTMAHRSEYDCKQRNVEEHLCRGCRNCGYTWDEPIREQVAS